MGRLCTVGLVLVTGGFLACAPAVSPTDGVPIPTTAAGSPSATDAVPPSPTPIPTQSPTVSPTPPPAPTPPTSEEWTTSIQLSRERFDSLELAVDRSGRAHAAAGIEAEGIWYLSNADGDWTAELASQAPPGGADESPAIAVADDGTIHLLFVRWDAWNPCYFECPPEASQLGGLFHVTRTGAGWSEPAKLPLEAAPGDWLGNIRIALAADGAHAVAVRTDDAGDSVWYGRQAGSAWTFELVSDGGWAPDLALTADEQPLVAFTRSHDAGYGLSLARRSSGTFTETSVPGTEGRYSPILELDADGRAHLLFGGDDGSSHYTFEIDGGWSEPASVGSYVDSAALDSNGALHLLNVSDADEREGLWYGTNRYGDFVLLRLDFEPRLVEDAPGPPSALAVDDAGRPHVLFAIYFAELRNGLWYAVGPSHPTGD